MLKEYIVKNGLKPFWEPGLKKPANEMSQSELVAHSNSISERVRKSAHNPNKTPAPSPDEIAKMYALDPEVMVFLSKIVGEQVE